MNRLSNKLQSLLTSSVLFVGSFLVNKHLAPNDVHHTTNGDDQLCHGNNNIDGDDNGQESFGSSESFPDSYEFEHDKRCLLRKIDSLKEKLKCINKNQGSNFALTFSLFLS